MKQQLQLVPLDRSVLLGRLQGISFRTLFALCSLALRVCGFWLCGRFDLALVVRLCRAWGHAGWRRLVIGAERVFL